jgi:hypothetical protein
MDDKSLKDLFEQNAAKADETQRAKAVEAALVAFDESPLKINDEATQGFTLSQPVPGTPALQQLQA